MATNNMAVINRTELSNGFTLIEFDEIETFWAEYTASSLYITDEQIIAQETEFVTEAINSKNEQSTPRLINGQKTYMTTIYNFQL